MGTKLPSSHPAVHWQREAPNSHREPLLQLRLAAMAGHMRTDQIAARRLALVDILADGKPHIREEIWQLVEKRLGQACWGKRANEALLRDVGVLRSGGLRIAYSRRPDASGYYLQHSPLKQPKGKQYDAVNWSQVARIRQLSVPEKNQQAFAAADFALRQKFLLLKEEHPDWTDQQIDREARRLVFAGGDRTVGR